MKTISRIAYSNDKKNKTRSILIMMSICLTTMLLVIISTVGNGMIRLQKSQAAGSYGSNYGLFVAADASQLKEVSRRAEIDAIGIMCTEGIIKGNENGGFVCMDETARKMLPYNKEYELKEGKYPEKMQEIAAGRAFFRAMGYGDIKVGDTLKNTASDLIGRSGKEELARKLYKEIRATDGVISAIDMMLHDYGPDHYSGSVNIEIDHKRSIGEVYEEIHRLQLRIMEEYHVTMVFGIYAVDEDTSGIVDIRRYIGKFVRVNEHVKSFHALYLSKETSTLYCDLIVDYALGDWEELKESFIDNIKSRRNAV